MYSHGLLIGVDVGGSKIGALVVDAGHRVHGRAIVPTDTAGSEHTLSSIISAIRQGLTDAGAATGDVAALGLGIPGRVDWRTGTVRLAVNLNLQELPLGDLLTSELGAPCFLENDVRVAALGLRSYGDNSSIENLAYLSIGTGISAGLILSGRLYRGAHGMAGEIGHMILDPSGPRCACGMRGCLEALTAGPAIARLAEEAVASGAETVLRWKGPCTAEQVYRAAAQGDRVSQAIAGQVGRYLGQAVQQLVMAYDIERVILGGGVSRAGDVFFQPIVHELDRQRQDSLLAREMLPPGLLRLLPPDYDAGMWGAITLAGENLSTLDAARSEGGNQLQPYLLSDDPFA